jgi:hypothetical protein
LKGWLSEGKRLFLRTTRAATRKAKRRASPNGNSGTPVVMLVVVAVEVVVVEVVEVVVVEVVEVVQDNIVGGLPLYVEPGSFTSVPPQ